MNKLTEQEKNIIEELRKLLVIDNSLNISQDRFDLIVDSLLIMMREN